MNMTGASSVGLGYRTWGLGFGVKSSRFGVLGGPHGAILSVE